MVRRSLPKTCSAGETSQNPPFRILEHSSGELPYWHLTSQNPQIATVSTIVSEDATGSLNRDYQSCLLCQM